MPDRKTLEKLARAWGNDPFAGTRLKLRDAAPALALACLEAREALRFAIRTGLMDEGEGYEREVALLDAALAQAGVEL